MNRCAESCHEVQIKAINLVSNLEPTLNFEVCIICQTVSNELPVNPTQQGYITLCSDMEKFIACDRDSLPSHIMTAFEDPKQFQELLQKHKSVYHKSCRNKYNTQKLNRLKDKRKQMYTDTSRDTPTNSSSAESPEQIHELCIFCNIHDSLKLSTVSSLDIHLKIINQAAVNEDLDFVDQLTKVSETSNIKYHTNCYKQYFKVKASKTVAGKEQENHFRESYDIVLKELTTQIEKSRHSSGQELFKLSQLAKVMTDRLDQMGFKDYFVHSTRLKDQLLLSVPGLRSDKVGREVLICFDDDVKHLVANAIKNNITDDDMILAKAANIIRNTLHPENATAFSGSLNKNYCAEKTVSKKLVTLLSLLIDGGAKTNSRIAENIAQIIQFNCVKSRKDEVSYLRHNIQREQPLPIYQALLIHSLTGQRKLVDELFDMGLSISYSRVMEIERVLALKVCETYMENNCVCPPNLKPGLFTTAAIDNIDHDPQSISANYSFHGTGISLIQHYDNRNNEAFSHNIHLEKSDFLNKLKPSLPKSYYDIPSLPSIDGELHLSNVNWDLNVDPTIPQTKPLEYTKNWLESCTKLMNDDSYKEVISWAAYNSRSCKDISSYKSTSAMLPLMKENINSPSMIQHCMNIIISATEKINSIQVPVITGDQPVYAIAKQIQYLYPEKYGEDKLVIMFGGLHIEKSFLAVIGTWLEGSGWEEALVRSGITTPGKSEAILKSAHIKRARYAHEVSLTAFNILLFETFKSETDMEDGKYFEWIEENRLKSPQFQYWITAMELQSILLQYVKCLRTADFDEYVSILDKMCPWYMVTDHTHYGRWLPIFVYDMKRLPVKHPEVYIEFKKGHFTSRQTNKRFSCISDDHLHEQNNKMVKESSSLLGMLNEESSLVKWMVGGPEIVRLISEYKNISSSNEDVRHHEDAEWFQSKFAEHVKDLVTTLKNKGPFSTTELTTIGNERKVINAISVTNVMEASKIGLEKYRDYVMDRLVMTKVSIHATMKQTQLNLFKIKPKKTTNKDKMKLAAANMDSNLFCKLYIACSSRYPNSKEFFKHENNKYPPSISEFGKMRKPTSKDEMLKCLWNSNTVVREEIKASAIIYDGYSLLQRLPPKKIMSVAEYRENEFDKFINKKCESYSRIDIVFDVNKESMEEMTEENCCQEKYVDLIDNETKMSNTKAWFTKFLKNTNSKIQFLKILAVNFVRNTPKQDKFIIGSEDHVVISSQEVTRIDSQLSRGEIKNRLLLHVEHAVQNGHQNILISTADSEIVIAAIYAFKYLQPDLQKLWIEISNVDGKSVTLNIHELYEIHKEKSDLLPFFNSFTGSGTTSTFHGVGKKTAWNVWKKFEGVNSAMLKLIKDETPQLCDEAMAILERFVILMYDSSSKATQLHESRRALFTKANKSRPIDRIPPTRDTLEQHVKRSLLQAKMSTHCLRKNIVNLEPTDWGWEKNESGKYTPVWTTIPILADHCQELISCDCVKCTRRCKCFKNKLKCTLLCSCEGVDCTQHTLSRPMRCK